MLWLGVYLCVCVYEAERAVMGGGVGSCGDVLTMLKSWSYAHPCLTWMVLSAQTLVYETLRFPVVQLPNDAEVISQFF